MNLSLSEALNRVHKWERQATKVYGMMLADSSPLVIKFSGHVSIHEQVIILAGEDNFELTLAFLPTMTFKYNDALLEITEPGWCCCIFENKPDRASRPVT